MHTPRRASDSFRPRSSIVELPACTREASVQFRTWALGFAHRRCPTRNLKYWFDSSPMLCGSRRSRLHRSSNGRTFVFHTNKQWLPHSGETFYPRHLAARISVFQSEHVGSSPIGGAEAGCELVAG